MYPFLTLFNRQIPSYWLLSMVGIFFAGSYLYITNRKKCCGHIPMADLLHLSILAGVGVIVGAKLLYYITILPFVISNWVTLWQNPAFIYRLLLEGMVFYGGLIGAIVAVYWYCKKYSLSFKTVIAIATPAIPLFHTFGRIGCFLAGCCWGIEVPWGITYTCSVGAPNHLPLLPIQLIEAGCNFLLFIFLTILCRKLKEKWLVFPLYIALYSLLRFILEFFRGDAIRGVALFSTSQWISLLLFILSAVFFITYRRNPAKYNK